MSDPLHHPLIESLYADVSHLRAMLVTGLILGLACLTLALGSASQRRDPETKPTLTVPSELP